ncbi:synaptic vesicle 2-related protein [Orussus abietinus]|uniref:synaptic vesicle 2-related protein n=1 Tax=Orussus abietinus TaxID=222816 RepID=UPI000625049B|nr:synaptic vesicle 2-related protein [Orussus abietinus]XP_012288609.1 synaptic vesicle 2-related protein [Orussus abietinus]
MQRDGSATTCSINYDRPMELISVPAIPDDTFTVGQAVNALGFGKFQVKLLLSTGLCWMADSMEITILSILSSTLRCDWGISKAEQALTIMIVFMSMMLSATFWGILSDRYGRKKSLTICAILLFYYGFLSSFSPSFLWILLLRGLVGFAIGCAPQSVTLFAEFLPTKQKSKCVILLDCFWALGASLEVVLALIVMPSYGWRWLLAISTLPVLIFATITPWLPESATFHVMTGRTDKAFITLERIAKENKKPMLFGRLIIDHPFPVSRGGWKDLFSLEVRRTSASLWVIWFCSAICYYGIVLITTELFNTTAERCGSNGIGRSDCNLDCQLRRSDYIDLLWTTLGEFPGIFFTVIITEKIGRKKTMTWQLIIFAVIVCTLVKACTLSRTALTIGLFLARGLIAGVFQAAYVYTPEVYPIHLRSAGVDACSVMARAGAMISPYIAQVLLQQSMSAAVGVYAAAALCTVLSILILPTDNR